MVIFFHNSRAFLRDKTDVLSCSGEKQTQIVCIQSHTQTDRTHRYNGEMENLHKQHISVLKFTLQCIEIKIRMKIIFQKMSFK